MNHIKLGVVSLERYLLYGLILSMATYAIPFMRIGSEELAFPIGGLFVPLSCFLLLIRILSSHRFSHHNVLVFSLLLLYFSIPLASFFSVIIEMDRIIKLSIFLILPILFTNALNNDRSLSISLYLIIAVGLVLAIYGFYGYFSGNVGVETERSWWLSNARYWGIHYLPSTRNSDIYYIAAPFFIIISVLFFAKLKSLTLKIFVLAVSVIFFTALVFSFSRGAWISAVVTATVFLLMKKKGIWNGKKPRIWLIVVCTFLTIVIGYTMLNYYSTYNYFVYRLESIIFPERVGYYFQQELSNKIRIEIIKFTFDIIVSHPLGVGPDNLRFLYGSYGLSINHAENAYLHVLAENGIFGFAGFSILVFYPVMFLYRKTKSRYGDWVTIGIFLTSIYLAVSYIFNVEVYSFYNWVVHSVIWSTVVTLRSNAKNA